MSTFLMVNPDIHGLRLWCDSWREMNARNVAGHSVKNYRTTMRNGDVYLWRRLEDPSWWCFDVDAVFFDDRCAALPLSTEQQHLLDRLRRRVR